MFIPSLILLDEVEGILKSKTYFKTGYPYIVDSQGTFLLHPTDKGGSIAQYDFFKTMQNNKEGHQKLTYDWHGKKKYQYYKYQKALDAFISITIYDQDLFAVSNQIRGAILMFLLIGVVVFVFINRSIINSIVSSLLRVS